MLLIGIVSGATTGAVGNHKRTTERTKTTQLNCDYVILIYLFLSGYQVHACGVPNEQYHVPDHGENSVSSHYVGIMPTKRDLMAGRNF